jgi:UDP-N-acetylglucosamine 2-epimerase (non-hydrolysing)
MKKILIVFGTRPEAIKMAPVVNTFKQSKNFETKVCVTAQHREMLDQVLEFFNISADYDLNLMKPGQNLYSLTSNIILGLKDVLEDFIPDYVLVHGDTTTTMSTSIASFYAGAKVCHVEAGLRTNNKYAPFPEEINRQVTSRITEYHFAPTEKAKLNLLSENILENNILITGNTVIDALKDSVEKVKISNHPEILRLSEIVDPKKKLILVTGHRRENFGEGFLNICKALGKIAERNDLQIIYPVHLNPNVQKPVYDILDNHDNINLIEPLSYESFIWLMDKSYLIITDSGGVQEEAPSLGKPVLVMRETTERPEAVDAGTVILVGTDPNKIFDETIELIDNTAKYNKMSHLHNPYGDGKASIRIRDFIEAL